jgi:hypothetical protein
LTFHLKSETSRWKKSPYFGSVDGDETHQYFKGDSSMESVHEYSMNFNPLVKVNFNGGDLTSDAGLLLYKSFDHKLGLSQTVEELCLS